MNQLYLVSGTTRVGPGQYVAGPPNAVPWGCNAPAGTVTPLLKREGFVDSGPFPCFTQFPTIAQRLDAANVSWNYYVNESDMAFGSNPFGAIRYVRDGPDWQKHIVPSNSRIVDDLRDGTLPRVSWVEAHGGESDDVNAPAPRGGGPAWVSSIVAAARASSYWPHLAIIVVWANDGDQNVYDNVPPPQYAGLGLGLRVPILVISPYAKRGYVSHTTYETGGSILRFIEETFGLPSLGATDARANSIADCFTY